MDPVEVKSSRKKITVTIPSIEGGIAVFLPVTVEQQMTLQKAIDASATNEERFNATMELIKSNFIEWNLVNDGAPIEFTAELAARTCTDKDLMFMLQAISGRQLLSDDGTLLTPEELAKKGLSA